MIYDSQSLKIRYKDYSNINQKISLETKKGNIIRIKRELYTDNLEIDKLVISNICYEPSYISFEYALSYYGLIPEHVSSITAACYKKKNSRKYVVNSQIFEYRSVPNEVFSYGIEFLTNEDGIRYKIASKEKALCDMLYSKYPVRFIKDLRVLLFEDLRIDEDLFSSLDFDFIKSISDKYHSNTINTLVKYVGGLNDTNRKTY
jgi:hypothetical protein